MVDWLILISYWHKWLCEGEAARFESSKVFQQNSVLLIPTRVWFYQICNFPQLLKIHFCCCCCCKIYFQLPWEFLIPKMKFYTEEILFKIVWSKYSNIKAKQTDTSNIKKTIKVSEKRCVVVLSNYKIRCVFTVVPFSNIIIRVFAIYRILAHDFVKKMWKRQDFRGFTWTPSEIQIINSNLLKNWLFARFNSLDI